MRGCMLCMVNLMYVLLYADVCICQACNCLIVVMQSCSYSHHVWLTFHFRNCCPTAAGWGDSSDGTVDGIVTNMHITDLELVSQPHEGTRQSCSHRQQGEPAVAVTAVQKPAHVMSTATCMHSIS
jgi:hypothetical protein